MVKREGTVARAVWMVGHGSQASMVVSQAVVVRAGVLREAELMAAGGVDTVVVGRVAWKVAALTEAEVTAWAQPGVVDWAVGTMAASRAAVVTVGGARVRASTAVEGLELVEREVVQMVGKTELEG